MTIVYTVPLSIAAYTDGYSKFSHVVVVHIISVNGYLNWGEGVKIQGRLWR